MIGNSKILAKALVRSPIIWQMLNKLHLPVWIDNDGNGGGGVVRGGEGVPNKTVSSKLHLAVRLDNGNLVALREKKLG